jgi:hypothetical protein
VSALPDCGIVADFDASGDVVLAVGGLVGVSAARTGAIAMESVNAVSEIRRTIFSSFLPLTERPTFLAGIRFVGSGENARRSRNRVMRNYWTSVRQPQEKRRETATFSYRYG